MRKTCKRAISLLLALLMFCSGSVAALAAPQTQTPDVRTQYDLDSTDKVGALFADAMADSVPDEAAAYAVTDVTLDGKKATVSFNNAEACTLVVALYTEEQGAMLGSGVRQVAANAGTADVTIEIGVMPQYFLLKAFLLDDNNAALCPQYTDIENTQGFEVFDAKTVDDFADDVVINFDDAKDENFAVLVDGAVEAKDETHNVLQSYDEKMGKYVFTNIDDTVRSLKEGDIFKSESDDAVILLKVKSISVDGTTATVYEETEADYADFFQFINVDENSRESEEHVTVNMDHADESVEFVGYSAWDDEGEVNASLEINESGKLCPEFKGTKYLVGSSGSTLSVVFTYGFKLSAEYELKMFYDVNWTWDFWNTTECLFCQLKLDFKLKGELGITGKFQFDLPLTELNYPTPVGIILTAEFDIHFEITASLTLTIDLISFTLGFRYVEGHGFENLCKAPQFKFEPKVTGTAEVRIALKPIPILSFIKVVAAEIQPEVGVKATMTLWTLDAMEAFGYKMPDKVDTCTQPCFAGVASLYFSCKVTGSFFGKTFGDFPIVGELTRKLSDFYVRLKPFSLHWGTCPNMAYRVDFTVENKDGMPIDNIDVVSGAPDLGDVYAFNEKNATDVNGTVSFYFPKGTYTVKVLMDGAVVAEKEVSMINNPFSVTITADTYETNGGGSGHHGGMALGDISACSVGDLIAFGMYPQSEVKNAAKLKTLNALPLDWKSYRYYDGNEPADYMQYADVSVGNERFRAVRFSAYRPYRIGMLASNSYSFDVNQSYQINNGYYSNRTYWFKWEPLQWRVLDPLYGLVICDSVIDAQAFQTQYVTDYDSYLGYTAYYSDKTKAYFASCYSQSTIRSWLNSTFWNTAFSDKERAVIDPSVECPNDWREHVGWNLGRFIHDDTTTDPIFLLTDDDYSRFCNNYGSFNPSASTITDYAQAQGATSYSYYSNALQQDISVPLWWTRSPYNNHAIYTKEDGGPDRQMDETCIGVRPAMVLNPYYSAPARAQVAAQREAAAEIRTAQADGSQTAATDGAVAGNEYVLLVRRTGTTGLTPENLLYIDQQTAESDSVTFTYTPRTAAGATVEIVGDFGSGVETRTTGEIEPPAVTVRVVVSSDAGSTVTGAGTYRVGDTVTLTAIAKGKEFFDCWYIGDELVGADNPYTFTAAEDVVIRAMFMHTVIGSVSVSDRTERAKTSFDLSPDVQAYDLDYTLAYSSDNADVATVDANGVVTTHRRGTATITVTATDEFGYTESDTCTVTVEYTWWQWIIYYFLFGWIWYK